MSRSSPIATISMSGARTRFATWWPAGSRARSACTSHSFVEPPWAPASAGAAVSDVAGNYRPADNRSGIEKAAQFARAARVLQLAQRLRLDLADALAGHRELLPDLFERVIGIHADAEAHAQHALLARGQRSQDAGRRLAQIGLNRGVQRQDRVLVLDEIAEVAVLLVADRGFEADRLLRDLQDLAYLFQRHRQFLGELLGGRLAADLVQHLARGAHQLVDRLDHVHRDADRARLVGDRARNRLADPPRRIGREFVAAAVLEFIDRLHQPDIAFLDQVEELQAAIRVFF